MDHMHSDLDAWVQKKTFIFICLFLYEDQLPLIKI